MKYQLNDFNRNIPDGDLLDDLKRVAASLKKEKISSREYDSHTGKYTAGTIGKRFGGWNKALERAGLGLVNHRNVSEEELFKNIEKIWIKLGRQPVSRDIKKPLSEYSASHYTSKFGTYRNALSAFVEFINSDRKRIEETEIDENNSVIPLKAESVYKHLTKRIPSDRLKVRVLMRDGNKCRLCGIVVEGGDIHFDHIKPWSKGGETVLENLQVLCSKHNIAKGNIE